MEFRVCFPQIHLKFLIVSYKDGKGVRTEISLHYWALFFISHWMTLNVLGDTLVAHILGSKCANSVTPPRPPTHPPDIKGQEGNHYPVRTLSFTFLSTKLHLFFVPTPDLSPSEIWGFLHTSTPDSGLRNQVDRDCQADLQFSSLVHQSPGLCGCGLRLLADPAGLPETECHGGVRGR